MYHDRSKTGYTYDDGLLRVTVVSTRGPCKMRRRGQVTIALLYCVKARVRTRRVLRDPLGRRTVTTSKRRESCLSIGNCLSHRPTVMSCPVEQRKLVGKKEYYNQTYIALLKDTKAKKDNEKGRISDIESKKEENPPNRSHGGPDSWKSN